MVVKAQGDQGAFAPYQNSYLVEVDEQAGVVQKQVTVADPVTPWLITDVSTDNFTIIHALTQTNQNAVIQLEQAAPTVDMFVQLAGYNLTRRYHQPDNRYQSNQYSLKYVPAFEGEMRFTGPTVSTFLVQFGEGYFRHFLDEKVDWLCRLADRMDQQRAHSLASHNLSVTPAMKAIMYDVLHCPFKGLVKRLFLEAKLVELLALQLDQIGSGQSVGTTLRPADVDKLMAVREWLDAHFLQPVTLAEVARLVSLNDFKLKKGFRELFSTTVFGYLTDLRMSHARQLLLDSRQTVTEVGEALGYQHVHHFSHAFRKHFGYLPSTLQA